MQQLIKEKESIDCNCSNAVKKVEEIIVLHNKSLEKIAALEEEKSQLTTAMVGMDMEKHNLSELLKEKNNN